MSIYLDCDQLFAFVTSCDEMITTPVARSSYLGCSAMSCSNCVGFLPMPASTMASSFSPETWVAIQ